jgi:hypothetical protein
MPAFKDDFAVDLRPKNQPRKRAEPVFMDGLWEENSIPRIEQEPSMESSRSGRIVCVLEVLPP